MSKKRNINIYRGCTERGFTDSPFTCGNPKCESCNMLTEAYNEHFKNMFPKTEDKASPPLIYKEKEGKKITKEMIEDKLKEFMKKKQKIII